MTGNYYKLLSIEDDVNQEEIEEAFVREHRKLKGAGSWMAEADYDEHLRKLEEAYDTLKDPATREIYDKRFAKKKKVKKSRISELASTAFHTVLSNVCPDCEWVIDTKTSNFFDLTFNADCGVTHKTVHLRTYKKLNGARIDKILDHATRCKAENDKDGSVSRREHLFMLHCQTAVNPDKLISKLKTFNSSMWTAVCGRKTRCLIACYGLTKDQLVITPGVKAAEPDLTKLDLNFLSDKHYFEKKRAQLRESYVHRTILVASTDEELVGFLRHNLKKSGFAVMTAGSRRRCEQLFAMHPFSVLVLPIDNDEATLTRMVLSFREELDEKNPKPYVVLVTSMDKIRMESLVDELSPQAVLYSGWTGTELAERVEEVFSDYAQSIEDMVMPQKLENCFSKEEVENFTVPQA